MLLAVHRASRRRRLRYLRSTCGRRESGRVKIHVVYCNGIWCAAGQRTYFRASPNFDCDDCAWSLSGHFLVRAVLV